MVGQDNVRHERTESMSDNTVCVFRQIDLAGLMVGDDESMFSQGPFRVRNDKAEP